MSQPAQIGASPQQQQQQANQQQQQQQQLVRPEDGELIGAASKLQQLLQDQQQQPDAKTTASALLAKLAAADRQQQQQQAIDTLLPANFAAALRDHYSPEKLKLSDAAAVAAKDEGNRLFTAQRFDDAVLCFTKAMLSVKSDEVYAVLLGNRSAAFLSAGMTLAAALDANRALLLLPKAAGVATAAQEQLRVKLLDRRARCLAALGEEAAASEDATVCKTLNDALAAAAASNSASATTNIPDRTALLEAKHKAALDDFIFAGLPDNAAATATFHPALSFTMDTQALPFSATTSYRRYASLNKDLGVDDGNNTDILRELATVTAVRTDALLVVCAQCCQRSSALYPSERHRVAGYRCRGLFCSAECSELHWKRFGEKECGVPFVMAASAEAVCALRVMSLSGASAVVQVSNSTSSSSSTAAGNDATAIFAKLPAEARPKLTSNNNDGSDNNKTIYWLVGDNVDLNAARSKETDPANAAYGGSESATALIGMVLGDFKTAAEAAKFVDIYRKIVAFLQPIVFVDRVFQSKVGGDSSSSSNSGTHATVPVTAALGYFPLATLFTHSCDPNCIVSFRGNPFSSSAALHIRLLRRVHEGELLSVSWGNVTKHNNHSTRNRIAVIRKLYGFTCCCTACASNPDEPISREKQEMMVKAADYYQKGRRLLRERRDLPEATNVLKQSLEILFRHVCPPPEPPIFVVAKTFDAIAQAAMLQGDAAGCLEYVRKRVEVLDKIEGEMSFEFVMELEKLAALLKNLNNDSSDSSTERAAVEQRAVRILRVMYPPSKSLSREIAMIQS